MSIKTFPGKEHSSFLIFLILSALMHAGIWGALRFFPSELRHKKEAVAPIPVEIIPVQPAPEKAKKDEKTREKEHDLSRPLAKREIVLPKDYIKTEPADPKNIAPFKRPSTHFSDRTQSVLKETVPDRGQLKDEAGSAQKNGDGQKSQPGSSPSAMSLSGKSEEQSISKGLGLKTAEPLKETDIPSKEGIGKSESPAAPKIMKEGTKRPNLFPSDERLADLNKEYEANPPKGEVGKKLQLNTSEFRFKGYSAVLARKLELYWQYPAIAIRNNWRGGGTIVFRINPDGTLSDFKFSKLSGYPALDDAILTALKLSTPFPPFPNGIDLPYLEFTLYFEYL